jgi:hypothetical protein
VASSADVPKALHQSFVGLSFAVLRGELEQPLAEEGIEGFVLRLCERAGLLDEVRLGAEGYVLHEYSVHEKSVNRQCREWQQRITPFGLIPYSDRVLPHERSFWGFVNRR